MSSDGTLLKEYAQSGSETAFTELVRRHLDFVFSTALRELNGDEHLAKDVSQSVFMDLAKKAGRLSSRSVLAGWLYTSTCFAAAKTVRSERRRRIREQEAQRMEDRTTDPPQDPDWEQISPVLNTVMLELKESDREALLLRFFERHSLATVGDRLGLSENAARMRVERALERLRSRLSRRGITSTAAGLALALAHHAVIAAPAGLASSITAASLAATGGVSLLNLVIMSKPKAIALGVAISAGALTPIVVQYQTNHRLRSEIDGLRAQLLAPPAAQPVSTDAAELERLRGEHEELMRLRGQLSALRQQVANKSNLPASGDRNRTLKQAGSDAEAENAKALLAKSPEIPMIPANLWVNAGFATPASTVQTTEWATVNRDTNALLSTISLEPESRAFADGIFARLPEATRQKYGSVDRILIDWRLNLDSSTVAYRILSQTEQGPDEATLVVQRQYADGNVRENSIQFYRDETGGWRQVMPPGAMGKLPAIIDRLAEASTATGK